MIVLYMQTNKHKRQRDCFIKIKGLAKRTTEKCFFLFQIINNTNMKQQMEDKKTDGR